MRCTIRNRAVGGGRSREHMRRRERGAVARSLSHARADSAVLAFPSRYCRACSRRHRGGDHALSRHWRRSDHARDPALGHRLSLRAAGGACCCKCGGRSAATGLAVTLLGFCFFGAVLRALQHRDLLHDGGAREPRALDAAAVDHGGRRAARHRDADVRARRSASASRCSAWSPRSPPACRRARRRLARRS